MLHVFSVECMHCVCVCMCTGKSIFIPCVCVCALNNHFWLPSITCQHRIWDCLFTLSCMHRHDNCERFAISYSHMCMTTIAVLKAYTYCKHVDSSDWSTAVMAVIYCSIYTSQINDCIKQFRVHVNIWKLYTTIREVAIIWLVIEFTSIHGISYESKKRSYRSTTKTNLLTS